jgi:Histidine kinase-like ATPase domain
MVYLESQDDLVATAAYAPEPAAVGAARRFVRDTLRSWQLAGPAWGQLVDDAVLLTSELVTNAVLHAGTPVQVTCRLLTGSAAPSRPAFGRDGADSGSAGSGVGCGVGCGAGGAVEITVLDRRPAQLRPALPDTSADVAERVSGRGLQLPSELASAWGVTYAREAKEVWFRMALRRPENAPRGAPVHAGCRGPG